MNARTLFPLLGARMPRAAHQLLLGIALLFLAGGSLSAQDGNSSPPMGPSGDYDGMVTTAGSYDSYTLNARRTVTDLIVPGSNGTYPLAFTRYSNSQTFATSYDVPCFGDGGNWRHSYQWSLYLQCDNPNMPSVYTMGTVTYPDGSAVTFRSTNSPNHNPYAPAAEDPSFWRGPTGTNDRLQVLNSNQATLWTTDGGQVCFGTLNHPTRIIDPYGAVTVLAYDSSNKYVTTVTEPGGRALNFSYGTFSATYANPARTASWYVLVSVTASTKQSVTFAYNAFGMRNAGGYYPPYCGLQNVIYNAEPATGNPTAISATPTNPNACVLTTYGYGQQVTYGPLVLTSAVDPHYAGAMTSIQYTFAPPGATVPYGAVQSECNYSTGGVVSKVSQPAPSKGVTTSTETRGDTGASGAAITRAFNYGEANATPTSQPSDTTYANAAMLTSRTDFQGNKTWWTYYGPGNQNGSGTGNLREIYDALGNRTTYVHEAITGKVTEMDLPDNRKRTWQWSNAANNNTLSPYYLQQSTDERGGTTVYHRNTNTGLLSQIDYPDSSHEYFTYTNFTYAGSAYYKLGTYTNKLGAVFTYTYGVNNNNAAHNDVLLSLKRTYTDPNTGQSHAETTNFQYDAMDRLIWTQDPGGVITKFTYNARHQLLQTLHNWDSTHVDYTYDDLGNCLSVSDELWPGSGQNHLAQTVYDSYRRPVQVTVPVNDGTNTSRTTSFVYDPRDQDANSLSLATSHTRSTWSVSWAPSGKGLVHAYSPNNWLNFELRSVLVSGSSIPGSSPVTTSQGAGFDYTYVSSYSAVGQVLTSVDANGQPTTYTYDNCGRMQTATDPLGHTTNWSYYLVNQPSSSTNYAGWLESVATPGADLNNFPTNTTTYTGYDAAGRVQGTQTTYRANNAYNLVSGYDAAGDPTSQSDGDQTNTTPPAPGATPPAHNLGYGYDTLGRKAYVTDPLTGAQQRWTYNPSGTVNTFKNYAGAVCTYSYDGRNRCIGYAWSDGGTLGVAYGYDAASRMTSVQNRSATVTFTYDDSGAVLTEKTQIAGMSAAETTTFNHDADGNVASILYPSGAYPYYHYDAQQRCTGMYNGGTTFSTYAYSGDRLASRSLLNGMRTVPSYQANGRVSQLWHWLANGSGTYVRNVSNRLYGYTPSGQVSWCERVPDSGSSGSSLENGRGDVYYYWSDGSLGIVDRNMSVSGNSWPSANSQGDSRVAESTVVNPGNAADTYQSVYYYDAGSNRSSVSQFYPAQNLTYYPQANNEYQYSTYDANGNTANSTAGWTYTYDSENKLTSASAGSQSAGFAYDGLGRLIAQTINGSYMCFYYAGSQRIEERNASNNLYTRYLFDGPQSDQILYREGSYGTLWHQSDLFGNTTHLSDGSGNVVEQYTYDCYGTPSVYDKNGNPLSGSTVDSRYLFKGAGAYEWLPAMGTYYCRARFYLPVHGRFLQPDPIGQAGGLNIYTYCDNDPINQMDSNGLTDLEHPEFSDSGSGDTSSATTIDPFAINLNATNGGDNLTNQLLAPPSSDPTSDQSPSDSTASPSNSSQDSDEDPSDAGQGGGDQIRISGGQLGSPNADPPPSTGVKSGNYNNGLSDGLSIRWGISITPFDNQGGWSGREGVNLFLNGVSTYHHSFQDRGMTANVDVDPTFLLVGLVDGFINGAASALVDQCFTADTQVLEPDNEQPISSIQVGARVCAQNDANDISTEVDSKSWKDIGLRLQNSQVAWDCYEIHALRSPAWMAVEKCEKPGDKIWFEMSEVGLRGWAEVVTISNCPLVTSGKGRVVLTTFNHFNNDLYKLSVQGDGKPIEVTGLHRLYSATRNDWVQVETLHIGENLRTRDGERKVVGLTRELGLYRVYNLEVEAEHCYYVSGAQVLAHNGCASIFTAVLDPGPTGGVTQGASISERQAIARIGRGQDVFAGSRSLAKSLAKRSSGNGRFVGWEVHGLEEDGYLRHYHTSDRNGSHIFFPW